MTMEARMGKENDALTDDASVEERAKNGEHMEGEETLFPVGSLEGDDITPQARIKRNLPVKVEASIGKAAVPLRSGLLDPNKTGRALVSFRHAKDEDVPERKGGDGADRHDIVGWTIRQHLTATYVQPANDEAALIRSEFAALCALDARKAAEVHAELAQLLEQELSAA
jgi:hypothetical protein